MIATRLKLANVRPIEAAEFRFHAGMNLVVGVNGVGKTTVLDALCACLSPVMKSSNGLRGQVRSFSVDDIRIGAGALMVECDVRVGAQQCGYVVHQPRELIALQKTPAGSRQQNVDRPEQGRFVGDPPSPVIGAEHGGRVLAVFFSTNRAVPSDRASGKAAAGKGITAAFADAFAKRDLRLGEFALWMQAQDAMRMEQPSVAQVLAACQKAVERFLPGYRNLRPDGETRPRLWIDRDGTTLPVRQLSDGERGSLALVLDLTRRLAQANPELDAPASEAEAVVMIDEIDLHLHPGWQRQIVHNLTTAFPRCQFIATTHSPPSHRGSAARAHPHCLARTSLLAYALVRRRFQPSAGGDHGCGPANTGDPEAPHEDIRHGRVSRVRPGSRVVGAAGGPARTGGPRGDTAADSARLHGGPRLRTITKGPEPRSLTAHRLGTHCDYDNYGDKAALRRVLVTEQRGLCCYCMGRIRDDAASMKIEHWRCQAHHSVEQLQYRNLLGACLGGSGQPPCRQHCDTRKGDRDLRWNPGNRLPHAGACATGLGVAVRVRRWANVSEAAPRSRHGDCAGVGRRCG